MTSDQERQATALIVRSQQGDAAAYVELLTLLAAVARRLLTNQVTEMFGVR